MELLEQIKLLTETLGELLTKIGEAFKEVFEEFYSKSKRKHNAPRAPKKLVPKTIICCKQIVNRCRSNC